MRRVLVAIFVMATPARRVLSELQDGSLELERPATTNAFVLSLRKARRRGHLVPTADQKSPVVSAAR